MEDYEERHKKLSKDLEKAGFFPLSLKDEEIEDGFERVKKEIKVKGLKRKQLESYLKARLSYRKGKALKRATLRLRSKVKPEPYRSIYFK